MSTIDTQAVSRQNLNVRVDRGGVEVVDALAAEWGRLCDGSPALEPFYRPEWIRASLLAFYPAATVLILSAWRGGRLRGVLPLMMPRGVSDGLLLRRLRFPGNIHGARVGLAHCGGAEGCEIVRALWDELKNLPGWRVIDLSFVVEGNGFDELAACARGDGFRTARRHQWSSLHLSAAPTKDDRPWWMAVTRPKFQSNVRRARRQLAERGELTLRHVATADPEALATFFALERSGWKGREGTAIACDPSVRRFYEEIAREAAQSGYLSLDFLELNGTAIAGHFGLQLHGRYLIVKAGYDERYRRYGPGHVLVHEVLNSGRALREFDFVGPAAWDETRWAQSQRNHYRICIFRKTLYGEVAYAARFGAKAWLKSLLPHVPKTAGVAASLTPEPALREKDA